MCRVMEYLTGDATNPIDVDGARIIAHCCNNIGKWGSGFVVSLSERWERPEQAYRKLHEQNQEHFKSLLGAVQIVPVSEDLYVANIIGQNGVRSRNNPQPIVYKALETGLRTLSDFAIEKNFASIHMPRIGCGLAGGSWEIVEDIIKRNVLAPVYVYDLPNGS